MKKMTALGSALSDVYNDFKDNFKTSRAAGVSMGESFKAGKDAAKSTFEVKKAELKELGLSGSLKPTKEPEETPPSEEVPDGRGDIHIEDVPETSKKLTEFALR